MILKPLPVQSDQFTWIKATREFIAEISDLGGHFGRVYDDACDEGLTLVSSRHPGKAPIVFVVNHEQRDDENELLYWDLVPAVLALRSTTPFTLRVFND